MAGVMRLVAVAAVMFAADAAMVLRGGAPLLARLAITAQSTSLAASRSALLRAVGALGTH